MPAPARRSSNCSASPRSKKPGFPPPPPPTTPAAARAQAHQVQAQIGGRVVRPPFAGWVSLRNISVGAIASQGTEIATVSDLSTIKLDSPAPETMLATLREGLPIQARSAAYPDRPFGGTIRT